MDTVKSDRERFSRTKMLIGEKALEKIIDSQELIKVGQRPHKPCTQFPPVVIVKYYNQEFNIGTTCVCHYHMYIFM